MKIICVGGGEWGHYTDWENIENLGFGNEGIGPHSGFGKKGNWPTADLITRI